MLAQAFLALLVCLSAAAAEEPLQVYFNERPPYQILGADGSVTGLTADPTAYALQKAGIPFTWVAMPPPRQLLKLQENRSRLAAVGWFRNPERERFAKYSDAIYQDRQIVVLARWDNEAVAKFKTVEALLQDKDLRLLRKVGYSYGKELDAWLAKWLPRTVMVTVENLNMVQMLHSRRADYMFIAPEESESVLRQAAIPFSEFQARAFPDMPPGEKRYLLFSAQVDDETIKRINRFIREYQASHK